MLLPMRRPHPRANQSPDESPMSPRRADYDVWRWATAALEPRETSGFWRVRGPPCRRSGKERFMKRFMKRFVRRLKLGVLGVGPVHDPGDVGRRAHVAGRRVDKLSHAEQLRSVSTK